MSTLFSRVSVHDTPTEKGRLPEKSGKYLTNVGEILFGTNTNMFQASRDYYPTHWYEPVDLPTEEEINKKSEEFEYHTVYDRHNASAIAKWVIDKIINKK